MEGKLKSECVNIVDFTDKNDSKLGIEPLSKFRGRIENFLSEVEKNYRGKNILIVTHAGVSIYAKCYFEGEPKDGNYSRYKLKNCEVYTYNV